MQTQFGIRINRFGFSITCTTNIPIVVEATSNGSIYFSDPAWNSLPTRAYRIRSP